MKVILLDIDGVLNVISQGHDEFGSIFHKHFEDNLRTIIDATGAKIVLSASMRANGLPEIQEMWKKRNLPGEVIDVTPYISMDTVPRGEEIKEWLDLHPEVTNYVIIDDDPDMLEEQMSHFVKTSDNIDHEDCIDVGYGLTKKCAEQVIKILNKI